MISKPKLFGWFLLIFALAFTIFVQATQARPAGQGHLVILRSANFGTYVTLQLWIDGRDAGGISRGRHYNRWIPAGRHVLTVTSVPNVRSAPPTSTVLSVRAGQLYVFTSGWDPYWGSIILQPSALPF